MIEKIKKLKKEKNALILAHYYQPDEIQDLADFVGDSYYLSEVAKDAENDLIVFCGVKFMAESAKILSPHKTILMPARDAGCAMADMVAERELVKLKEKHLDALTVAYINTSASVKAHCDVCVTSSSALNILNNIDNEKILFVPDQNLGEYIAESFPEKEFIFWEGYCEYHNDIKPEEIVELREKYDSSLVLVHPECKKEIRDLADYIGSTSGIINFATDSSNKNFIVATEEGILHELKKRNPDKNFYIPGGCICCKYMKFTTLENLYSTLLNEDNEIFVDEAIRQKALNSLVNMHKFAQTIKA